MCLILFALKAHADYPLVIAANRDEYHRRPTAPAAYWSDRPDVLGGRDLAAHGSWLALSRAGRLGAVTNFRDGRGATAARSRGHLVADFIGSQTPPDAHIAQLETVKDQYGGFNLLLYAGGEMHYASNRAPVPARVALGIHGLSNHLLDTPWPKVSKGKARLARILEGPPDTWRDALFDLLYDAAEAGDAALPHTGVAPAWERKLSAAFILTPDYGTRASTVVRLRRDGHVDFIERSFDADGRLTLEQVYAVDGFLA